jgi:hypothetical protein
LITTLDGPGFRFAQAPRGGQRVPSIDGGVKEMADSRTTRCNQRETSLGRAIPPEPTVTELAACVTAVRPLGSFSDSQRL